MANRKPLPQLEGSPKRMGEGFRRRERTNPFFSHGVAKIACELASERAPS